MRGLWLFCLCVLLLAQPPELMVIDNFESEGNWEPLSAEGCTIKVLLDRLNTREGQSSLRLEVEFTEACEGGRCFAGITRKAPDLTDYAFLRLWLKADAPANAAFGIYLETTGEGYYHFVPLDNSRWNLMTVSFSDFETEGEQSAPIVPESIQNVSLALIADQPVTVKVNVDEFVALTDSNGNGIPDLEEAQKTEAAENSEEFAQRYFNEGDYEKARKYYEEARSLYQQAGNSEKAQEMELKVKESVAWQNFERGEDLYEQEEHIKAMEAYERARRDFVLLGNPDMVDTIESRLEELSELTGRPLSSLQPSQSPEDSRVDRTRVPRQRSGVGGLLFILLLVCIVGVGIYLWKFRGEKAEEEAAPSKPAEPLKASEAKAEKVRKLKAKFVYGEINRKEYEKKLRELEEN